MLVYACGAAHVDAPVADGPSPVEPLPCAGRTLEDSMPIPELGPLPSGDPVTAGIALACHADTLTVMDWGPGSSSNQVVARSHAMEIWNAFQEPATRDERRLRVLLLLESARLDATQR